MVMVQYTGSGKVHFSNPKFSARDIKKGDVLDMPSSVAKEIQSHNDWVVLAEKKDVNKKERQTKEEI